MENLVQAYLAHLGSLIASRQKRYSQNTLEAYAGFLNRFNAYLAAHHGISLIKENASDIGKEIVDGYYQSLLTQNRSVATLNNYVSILKGFFTYLKTAKFVESDPCEGLYRVVEPYTETPPLLDEEDFYTIEQLVSLYQYLNARSSITCVRDRAMISMMLSTGLRVSEVCGLNFWQYKKMQKEGGAVVLRKGGKWSRVEVGQYALEDIAVYLASRGTLEDDDPLFITSHGNRMDRKRTWDRFRIHQDAIELKRGTHIFRHTAITHVAYDKGIDEASRFADHASKKTTARYRHKRRDVAAKTAETLSSVHEMGLAQST